MKELQEEKTETPEELIVKGKTALKRIKEKSWNEEDIEVLVVWHVWINRALVAAILWLDTIDEVPAQEAGALSVYDYTDKK